MKNASFNTQDVKRACERKLQLDFGKGKELSAWFIFNGVKTARITVPKGRKPIPPKTYKSMAVQLKLDVDQFDAFLECTFGHTEYLEVLSKQIS